MSFLKLFLLSAVVPLKKAEAAAAIRARGYFLNIKHQLF
jgi:hypothetical protein